MLECACAYVLWSINWCLFPVRQIESVELALGGRGEYLGITDKEKLLGQLEVLQTKEAQLQKKELLIMTGASLG